MVSIETIQQGFSRYLDAEILPKLPTEGLKGFGIRVAATSLVMRGGDLIRGYAKTPPLQYMRILSPDGAVDLDFLRDVCKQSLPDTGLPIDLPAGISLRLTTDDIDSIYSYIKEVR